MKLLKALLFVGYFLVATVAAAEELFIYSDGYDKITLSSEENFIVDDPKVLRAERSGNSLYFYPKQRIGKTTVKVFSGNKVLNYFVEVGPRPDLYKVSNRKAFLGTFGYRRYYDYFLETQNYNEYLLNLDLYFTDDISLNIDYLGNDSELRKNQEKFNYQLNFYKNFIAFRRSQEPTISLPQYSYGDLKLYEVGRKTDKYKISAWKGENQLEGKFIFQAGDSSGGVLELYDTFLPGRYFFNYSGNEKTKIQSSAVYFDKFIFSGLSQQLGYSANDKEQTLFFSNTGYSFGGAGNSFTFRNLNFNYSLAPEGSYGLYTQSDISRKEVSAGINLANKNLNQEDIDDIDNIEGVFSVRPGYNYRGYGDVTFNSYLLNLNFNNELISLGMNNRLETKEIPGSYNSEGKYVNPYLNVYFYGDRKNGWYLRNDYQNSVTSDSLGIEKNSQRNTLGLFRNYKGFTIGAYGGQGQDQFSQAKANYYLYGGELAYRQNNKKIAVIAEQSNFFLDSGEWDSSRKSLAVYGDLRFGNHVLTARVRNYQNLYQSGEIRSSLYGYLGYTFNFGGGDRPIVPTIQKVFKTASIEVFEDSNFNGIREPSEKLVPATITLYKSTPDTESSSGRFSFSNLEDKKYYFNVDKLPEGFSITNQILVVGGENMDVLVPVYKFVTEKVSIINLNKEQLLNLPLSVSCEGNPVPAKVETFSDYLLVKKPNPSCLVGLDFNQVSNYVLLNQSVKGELRVILVKEIIKVILGQVTISGSQQKATVMVNNQKVRTDNKGNFSLEIKPYEDLLSIRYQGRKCKVLPSQFRYQELQNQTYLQIFCSN